MNDAIFHPRQGAFGAFGGRYASELLQPVLDQLERALHEIVPSESFQQELRRELMLYAGRATPLTHVARFSKEVGLEVYLKREDLLHGGAHKTNNVVGQGLLARHLGKTRLTAETGAGQHGAATAMIAARLGMDAVIYMGATDIARQRQNVKLMELCGATVVPVSVGSRGEGTSEGTLKDAINEALRDWTASADTTHYLLGTVCGPHPFPTLVREFQRVIGDEAREQFLAQAGGLPDAAVACVGGGSNAIGLWTAFLDDDSVRLIGVEPGGTGSEPGDHGASLGLGRPGVLHGARTYVLQDAHGQIGDAKSIAAGLDYPGVGPEHAALKDGGRATYLRASDQEALRAFELLSRSEGIVPAFESAHALALVMRARADGLLENGAGVLVNLSGRGQKDLDQYFTRYSGGGGTA